MKSWKIGAVIAVLIIIGGILFYLFQPQQLIVPETQPSLSYWPTEDWRTSTPEQQGMDSEILAEMFEYIEQKDYRVDSIIVIRNGYLVLEAYAYPFGPDKKHLIHSCTKSFTSSLVGIAIDEGYIEGVEQPVLEIFPERTVANIDANKEAITVEHLLIMAPGLECHDSYLYGYSGLYKMIESEDWVQFMLDLPMAEEPGTRFEYCNGASFLLSAIIQQTTGVTAYEYAKEHLFSPLGITDVDWPSNPQGITHGAGEIRISPCDMAKFGYLYLNKGMWEGEQVVPSEWVEASTRKHISATWQDGYGYQWWVNPKGIYNALGTGWQYIFVVSKDNMVVVFTTNLHVSADRDSQTLLYTHIIPAVKSDEPLPENPEGVAKLESSIDDFKKPPEPKPVPPLPEMAYNISGKTYELETNNHNLTSFTLTFQEEEAIIEETLIGDYRLVSSIGLDGVPRINDHGELGTWAVKGYWQDENTFIITYQLVGDHLTITTTSTFQNKDVSILSIDTYFAFTPDSETITGKQK
ncbi:serine hydrolase domain-containing protein [[Eubacterium] cellulosolvens]